jgi:hypothetical protein
MKTVTIVQEVKLTTAERLALMDIANDGGKFAQIKDPPRVRLSYLGLIERCPQHDPEQVTREVAAAWKALSAAVRKRDARAAEDSIGIIRNERWKRERTVWRLTPAASEYLEKGRVTVTVGKAVPDKKGASAA